MKIDVLETGKEDRLAAWAGYSGREVLKAIPGARWNKHEMCWTYPLAFFSALALGVAAKRLREDVVPTPEAASWVTREMQAWQGLASESEEVGSPDDAIPGFYGHQVRAAQWYAMDGAEGGRLDTSQVGCLVGDTELIVNRAGRGFRTTIERFVHKFHSAIPGGRNGGRRDDLHLWDSNIDTKIAYRANDGTIRSGKVKDCWVSGEKNVYTVTTATGESITASASHPFLTPDGWKKLGELSPEDTVCVRAEQAAHKPRHPKMEYKITYVSENHPYARCVTKAGINYAAQWGLEEHRAVAEAGLNGMTLQEFKDNLKNAETASTLLFIDPKAYHVHHIDLNHRNNSLENLQVLTPYEHHRLHAEHLGKSRSVLYKTVFVPILSIVPAGKQMTYDIEMDVEPHNYIANGFVVHNSGKTRSALRAAWLCWSKGEKGILLISTLVSIKHGWNTEVEKIKEYLPLPGGVEWQVFTVVNSMSTAKKKKTIADAGEASEASGGVGVVLITNHEQLRTYSRLSGYGDIALRRCPQHGGVKEGNGVVSAGKCQVHDKELNGLKYVAVCIDEAHRFMNPKSQTTRAGWAICDSAPRVWGLTGTPGSKSVVENTWALDRLVYGKNFPSKSKWCEYFGECGFNVMGFWEVGGLREEHEPEFRQLQAGISRRVLTAQVLDLPPFSRGGSLVRYLDMGKEQRSEYEQMRDQLILRLEEGDVTAANRLALTARLSMLASATGAPGKNYGEIIGHKSYQDEFGDWVEKDILDAQMDLKMPSCKIDAVVDMILGGDVEEGTVFQFSSAKLLYLCRDAMVKHKCISNAEHLGVVTGEVPEYKRNRSMDLFQAGKIPFFAFTCAAGGAGITLTRANTMVAVERPWSSILYTQAEGRIYRAGSEIHDHVNVIDLVTSGTVEEHQMEVLEENAENLETIVQDKKKLLEMIK